MSKLHIVHLLVDKDQQLFPRPPVSCPGAKLNEATARKANRHTFHPKMSTPRVLLLAPTSWKEGSSSAIDSWQLMKRTREGRGSTERGCEASWEPGEPVKRADVWPVGCSQQRGRGRGRSRGSEVSLAGRSQGGAEERSRHAGYAMIIVEHRGRLFSALNTRAGRQEGRAGVQEGEEKK